MSCRSWNCRGLGNPRTVRALKNLVRDRNPDVLFLSETISVGSRIEMLRVKLRFDNRFSVDRNGKSSGLVVFWRNLVDCSISGYSQNHIDLVFKENNVDVWRLTCYYGCRERNRRRQGWNLIRSLARISNTP